MSRPPLQSAPSPGGNAGWSEATGRLLLTPEPLSCHELARLARLLARRHVTMGGGSPEPLLSRLRDNELVLRRELAVMDARPVHPPAAEWLLDNQHVIFEQARAVRRFLPRSYGRELPRLAGPSHRGLQRVYALALELITHSAGRIDLESLDAFTAGYQGVAPLTLGELWALPIMLRLALIENLRQIAERVAVALRGRAEAVRWAERLAEVADDAPSRLVVALAELSAGVELGGAFVAELQRRLQGQSPALALVLQWLDQRLGERLQTTAEVIRAENQAQAADQVAAENAITGLRRVGALDWRGFVERRCPIEAELRRDPAGVYAAMDFVSRDGYRREVELLARRCRPPGAAAELAVAQRAVALCGDAGHVGELLVGGRRGELERDLAAQCGLRWPRGALVLPWWGFAAPVAGLAAAASGFAWLSGGPLAGLLAILPASQAAVAFANWTATRLVKPRRLPRLELDQGIPAELPTVVAVPTLLRTARDADALAEGLLVRWFANRDERLTFVLLTDFGDAQQEHLAADDALVARMAGAVAELNRRHGPRFALLHRPRLWDPGERCWMGRERKRGKLEDLNRLILHGDAAPFSAVEGDLERLRGARYVIVLDTDTGLPRDAARQLVATMAHPLNRPVIDPRSGRVVAGHAILQPRAAIALGSARRSWFASLWSGDAGIDPYTRAISDVYQDLFDAGSFIGKGIYDVAAFHAAVDGRFPPDAILSHDLIEGGYARCGLASDILVVEDHPARYLADVARRQRWIRGDWQLLPWLWPWTPSARGRARNALDGLSLWKIADNLRRSLVPPSALALLLAAWCLGDAVDALLAGVLVAGAWLLPTALGALAGLLAVGGDLPWESRLREVARATARGLAAALGELCFLPYAAAVSLDAILRTLWRLHVSRRHLLAWVTASDAERLARGDLPGIARVMAVAPLAGLAAGALAWLRPEAAAGAAPWAIAWLAAPLVAWVLSRPRRDGPGTTEDGDRAWLLQHARRTWRYFEDFVGPEDRFLAPDNFQERPVAALAHRTSPTNIGLGLLADLAAHDLGFLPAGRLLDRLEAAMASLGRLERHRGHLLNWYDTRTGAPLAPRYVSTVDSGNLAGHLLVLAAGLREFAAAPAASAARLRGCAATLSCAGPEAAAAARAALDLRELAAAADRCAARLDGEAADWCRRAAATALAHAVEAERPDDHAARAERALALALAADQLACGMEWGFLLDPTAKLFAIGFQVDEARLDRSQYDLLASESRLASYVAVSLGTVPQEHWFSLGRQQLATAGGPVLASWTGTMFEYLMPALVMPEEPGTLLSTTAAAAVAEQQRWGRTRKVPWGVSESAYHHTDAAGNWQYRAFGVPALGLKRDLGQDTVVAPYASLLALLVDPAAAIANLRRLESLGLVGRCGFHEAIDFTPARLQPGSASAIVPSWMAHHQGMSLLAIQHLLDGAPMRRRFLADPRLLAHRLLLQERPAAATVASEQAPAGEPEEDRAAPPPSLRTIADPLPAQPEVHLLSNGSYHLMVTSAGTGQSRWQGRALTRWREDPSDDHWGPGIWLRDLADGAVWSATHHPAGAPAESYEAVFSQAHAEFRRLDRGIYAVTEIGVSPEDDVEVRRLHLTNRGDRERRIEITTYAEPVLAPAAADLAHPAFSNLFVETALAAEAEALIASRRPRRPDEPACHLAHLLAVRSGAASGPLSWESDRAVFLGRGRPAHEPLAMSSAPGPLGGGEGAVLDPCLALRRTVVVPAGGRVTVDAVYAAGASRERVRALAHRYRDGHLADRVFDLAESQHQASLAQIGASEAEALVFDRLAGSLVFATAHRRAPAAWIARNRRTRSTLWSLGISGDLPICLLRIADGLRDDLVRQLLRAHAWWTARGLACDLVLLVEDASTYRQELTEGILGLVSASPSASLQDQGGGVFVRRLDQVPEEDRHLLAAAARLVVSDDGTSLAQLADRRARIPTPAPRLVHIRSWREDAPIEPQAPDLVAGNGLGGFSRDGREYVVLLPPGRTTPLPWCNVLANPGFGCVVSERGAGYTWTVNCHEHRLTPWRNDPVADPHGEVVYLRDDETGAAWCPTPGPLPCRSTRLVRHGFGYSVFSAGDFGIASELHLWVDAELPVKRLRLRLANRSGRVRRLSVMLWVEWVLGEQRERTAPHLRSEHDDGVLTARNPLDDELPELCAFAAASRPLADWTCDRGEFLGRGGAAARPAALGAAHLLARAGAGLDPGAALRIAIELAPGQEEELAFAIGAGASRQQALELAAAQRSLESAHVSLDRVREHWRRWTGTVQVRTADPALDLLANGWLAYQAAAARILARSGYYQSGGAWGFRDQLQDAAALVHHQAGLLREQLLRAAGRQFTAGDVQHWWHPPSGRGVRSRCSDDLLWLPWALCRYLEATGDRGVLDEAVPFLDAPPLADGQEASYDLPATAAETASLYEHAARAAERAITAGPHGLPLIGGGDWNDGLDRVGLRGRGESVWLGFFLADVLRRLAPVARARGDAARAERFSAESSRLAAALDAAAWDGSWYRRAWTDEGEPLGAAAGEECRIDALPQAWAALSGLADPLRARQAMESVDRLLVRRDEGLVLLFDPPFDQGPLQPGYIKGYLPGVRENGGQYTHAAVWTAMGFAALGDGRRALELARLLSPVRHGADPQRWKAEPYAMAADVYRAPGHVGRAGWSWYTGSAGWMLRLILESLLGLERRGDALRATPCTPAEFGDFAIDYRLGGTSWSIAVSGTGGVRSVALDGVVLPDEWIPLVQDGGAHRVEVRRG